MSIKIIIEGDTPLKVLSQCAALGLRCMMDDNVGAAANQIIRDENPKQGAAPEDEGVDWSQSYAPETIHSNNGATYDNTLLLQNKKSPVPAAPVTPPPVAAAPIPAVAAVPLAPAPVISLEQVAKAGADLISGNPAKMQELVALLQRFGVPAVQALKPDQIGAFATELRGLGAKI